MNGDLFAFSDELLAAVIEHPEDAARLIAVRDLKEEIARRWRDIGCTNKIVAESQVFLVGTPDVAGMVDGDALKVTLGDNLLIPVQYFRAGGAAIEGVGFVIRYFEPFTARETLDAACRCMVRGMRPGAKTSERKALADLQEKHGPIRHWDVSAIADLSSLFEHTQTHHFNPDISAWKTRGVENMASMFAGSRGFNCDLNEWDVSSVTTMEKMFAHCTAFNSPLDKWATGACKNMRGMFYLCRSFSQSLQWDCSSCRTMFEMFTACGGFNGGTRLDFRNTGMVRDVQGMFRDCRGFSQWSCVFEWDLSAVEAYNNMFFDCDPLMNDYEGAVEKFLAAGWDRRRILSAAPDLYRESAPQEGEDELLIPIF
eukprot:g160.t1